MSSLNQGSLPVQLERSLQLQEATNNDSSGGFPPTRRVKNSRGKKLKQGTLGSTLEVF